MTMTFPRTRLVVSLCLFVAWLGFLLYLVLQNEHMTVLSRPQFLAADLCVSVELKDNHGKPEPTPVIDRVFWGAIRAEDRIEVKMLAALGPKEGYEGPGRYLLPLLKVDDRYELVPVPAYPMRELRIYRSTPQTDGQLAEIRKLRGM